MGQEQKTEEVKAMQESIGKSDAAGKFSGRKWGIIGGIAVVLIAFVVGISIYNTPASRLSRELDLGQRYLEEQNYEQAIVEFDKAIEIDPMSVEAYLGKAQAYDGMGDIEMAVKTLEDGYDRTGDERLMDMIQMVNPVIEWEDTAFEVLIREYLGKPEGDIKKSEVCNIESIEIFGTCIMMPDEKLSGFRTYDGSSDYGVISNKREIDHVTHGKIETLNDLQYFTTIQYLYVRENNISDISVLRSLTNLTGLCLFYNNISDISVLEGLTNLTELGLFNDISDISVLGGLTNLIELNLYSNNISDISALGGLMNLTVLSVGGNNISDISALEGLTNLTVLSVGGNNISDISALEGLTNLTVLSVSNTNISDISALEGLANLTELYLCYDNISDISALGALTNLTRLDLKDNNISDISALGTLTNLTDLNLRDNNISDYSPVSFVENLSY